MNRMQQRRPRPRLDYRRRWLPRLSRRGSTGQTTRRQLDAVLLGLGMVCLLAAITAGAVEVLGNKLPVVSSPPRQVLLAIVGAGFVVASYFFTVNKGQADVVRADTVVALPTAAIDPKQRRRMLERVNTFWIKGVLEQSLRSDCTDRAWPAGTARYSRAPSGPFHTPARGHPSAGADRHLSVRGLRPNGQDPPNPRGSRGR